MQQLVSLGVAGAVVEMGAHVCGFFNHGDLRREILDGFVAGGVRAGHKCYCLLDCPDPVPTGPAVGSLTGSAVTSGQVEFMTRMESYLPDGTFAAPRMLTRLEALVTRALHEEAYPAVRAVGEMSWASEAVPGAEEVSLYESEVNRLAGRYPQVLLCLYDLSRFRAEALVEVLKTHPWILIANVVLKNPYYLDPDEYLAGRGVL